MEQLNQDHGKRWKTKELGYNPRVAEKKSVIVKRVREYVNDGRTPEQVPGGAPCPRPVWSAWQGCSAGAGWVPATPAPGVKLCAGQSQQDGVFSSSATCMACCTAVAGRITAGPVTPVSAQAIERLEREQAESHLPLSRFIDSIRPGKGKRKQREEGSPDDDTDEAGQVRACSCPRGSRTACVYTWGSACCSQPAGFWQQLGPEPHEAQRQVQLVKPGERRTRAAR